MDERKRVYIAGKTEGNPYAKTQFEEAYRVLERHGFYPLSPFHCSQCMYDNMTRGELAEVNFLFVAMADYVCLLPNFLESAEALAEYQFAVKKDKGIIDAASGYRVILEPGWKRNLTEENLCGNEQR